MDRIGVSTTSTASRSPSRRAGEGWPERTRPVRGPRKESPGPAPADRAMLPSAGRDDGQVDREMPLVGSQPAGGAGLLPQKAPAVGAAGSDQRVQDALEGTDKP